mmetsp:Transcript_468/g.1139  ORF Transcript_468/g.1139 Transcript_468/m.1139 type:complete len:99 (+) Transcript_468:1126-1422(+)
MDEVGQARIFALAAFMKHLTSPKIRHTGMPTGPTWHPVIERQVQRVICNAQRVASLVLLKFVANAARQDIVVEIAKPAPGVFINNDVALPALKNNAED